MRVGLDFDNTIAEYDHLFAALAVETGLFDTAPGGKREVRDQLRPRPKGELAWRQLQAMAYGLRLEEAQMFEGLAEFLKACSKAGYEVVIVSHKTRYPACREFRTDMREAAMDWLSHRGFFDKGSFGLKPENVHFADSRAEKVSIIADLDCDVFVDDLEEVFIGPGFPVGTRKVLFAPDQPASTLPLDHCRHWREITDAVIGQPVHA